MIYHHIALNVPIANGLLSYAHPETLPIGRRVQVLFRGKPHIGIVWANHVQPDIDVQKILPIQKVFEQEALLPESWRELVAFASRYYHYPLGQVVATALPQGLKENKALAMPETVWFYRLSEQGKKQAYPVERFVKKRALWQALHGEQGCSLSALKRIHHEANKWLIEWQEQGWVERLPEPKWHLVPSAFQLNHEQQAAANTVQMAWNRFAPFLLHGITGSGKTEVYFDMLAKTLNEGGQALFLLPEINLTPQLLQRIHARFQDIPTAILHSQAPSGKRTQDYLRAMLGQAKLVIGTRLAVFTPMADLRLIVVDEEHDTSFKQDNELRYHARDLAVWRAKQANCPIVLGSATPSLESWHKAKNQVYGLISLNQRANPQAKLPDIHVININRMPLQDGFAPMVLQRLKDNMQKGGLSLVYLNRRGFAPALFCGDCGLTFGCPHCSAKMVLHQRVKQLRCHHCDYRQAIPHYCPDCGNQDLTAVGYGTQRIEERLRTLLPSARVLRVDRDSVVKKDDWQNVYQTILQNEVDILVGTQMLAKGHDFARLNLVVVLNADGSLYSSDFRSPERLFAELMQVSGRAGRAEQCGQVYIQTRLPEHAIFSAIQSQDYAMFADKELAERQTFQMPPFAYQAVIRADSPQLAEAMAFLNQLKQQGQHYLPKDVQLFGATPMLMARLAERERAQLFLESASRTHLHQAVGVFLQLLHQQRSGHIRWSVDIDPQEM